MTTSRRDRSRFSVLVAAAVSLLSAGCSGGVQRAPVEGTVLENGRPAVGIQVIFEPVVGEPGVIARGVTDSAGKYSLMDRSGKQPGAIVGPNRVSLSVYQKDPGDELTPLPKRKIPRRYRDGSTVVEVSPGGTDSADFAL